MILYAPEIKEVHQDALTLLEKSGYVVHAAEPADKTSIKGLLVRTYTQVTTTYLRQYPNLKFVIRVGVGLDNIDTAECKRRSIAVYNAPGSNAVSVAEYVVLMILLLLRRLPNQLHALESGLWRQPGEMGQELKGKVVGLIGCGAVGKYVASLLKPFGAVVRGYDKFVPKDVLQQRGIEPVTFDEVIEESDIITVQIPYFDNMKNMFDTELFAKMKDNALFMSVSRGALIDEQALIKALNTGKLLGAAIDGAKNEPNINKRLLTAANLTITPHIGGYTREADRNMAVDAVNNLLKGIEAII